jgi:hypothetical protein
LGCVRHSSYSEILPAMMRNLVRKCVAIHIVARLRPRRRRSDWLNRGPNRVFRIIGSGGRGLDSGAFFVTSVAQSKTRSAFCERSTTQCPLTYWKNKNKILLIRIVATRGDDGLGKATQKSTAVGCTCRGRAKAHVLPHAGARICSWYASSIVF